MDSGLSQEYASVSPAYGGIRYASCVIADANLGKNVLSRKFIAAVISV